MKRIIVLFIVVMFAELLSAQNTYKYQINAQGGIVFGKKSLSANKLDSAILRGDSIIFYQAGVQQKAGSGGGAAADTLHLSTRIDLKLTKTDTTSMLSRYSRLLNPQFVGTPRISTDTVSTKAYARSVGGGGGGTLVAHDTTHLSSRINLKVNIADTATMLTNYIARSDTSTMLTPYARKVSPIFTGVVKISTTDSLSTRAYARSVAGGVSGFTNGGGTLTLSGADAITLASTTTTSVTLPTTGTLATTQNINDSLDAYVAAAETGIALADSSGNAQGNYITRQDLLVEGGLHVNIADTASMLTNYIARGDTAAMLEGYVLHTEVGAGTLVAHDTTHLSSRIDLKADLANPNFTGTVRLATNDTLSTRAYARSIGGGVAGVAIADSTAGDGHYSSWYKAENIRKTVKTFFVFAVGGGNAADTVAITDSTILGSFYNGGANTIVIDTLNAIMKHGEGLDTLGFNIYWSKNFYGDVSASSHASNTQFNCGRTAGSPAVYTNLIGGNVFTTFDHNEIPPGQRVWMQLPYHPADGLKRKPRYFEVSLIGHYK
jgi:hypothetical protein